MQLTPGFRVGVYEVLAPIGAGGMGEVYRAHDTVLDRDVALKVLSRETGADPDRQRLFEREARAVAALSHPNILAIYGFGHQGAFSYAAMELLEGHTLRREIARGPLPVPRAIDIGAQMALGLAAAHDKGIVHGDVKPENVFVTDGRVKLLDFGLARTVKPVPVSPSADTTPAEAWAGPGMVMGTLGYISPEQVSGSEGDHRSDLFSLGVMLFEMLTGREAFRRASAIETLNAALKDAPPSLSELRPGIPSALERIVMRCLEKVPSERFQSARDLAFALQALAMPATAVPAADARSSGIAVKRRRRFIAVAAVLVSLGTAALVQRTYRTASTPHDHPLVTFTIPPPAGAVLANVPSKMLAISPDGDHIVFAVSNAGQRELWIRHLEAPNAERLPGTQNASEPFWSPDGQQIGFFADGKLKRISRDGATLLTVCDAPLDARGATWNRQGTMLFSDAHGGLSRVPATGGIPARVTMPDREGPDQSDSWPQFLPDGHRFLYLRRKGVTTDMGGTAYLGTLDGGGGRPLLSSVFNALFIAPNFVLFSDARALKIQRVDVDRAQMVGDIEDVMADVDRHLGRAALAVSERGTLVYAAGSPDTRLVWVDRNGRETGVVTSAGPWRDIALSPGGSHVAVQRIAPDANDIWTVDLLRGVPSRFTLSADIDDDPVWSPDGRTIAYSSVRDGIPGISQKAVDGTRDEARLLTHHLPVHPTSWSPDARVLLFEQTDPVTQSDIWALPVRGDHTPHPYLVTAFAEKDAQFSPDGRWVAYTSDESGRDEVYVQDFPNARQKRQISTDGGVSPRWAPDGHELYFLSRERRLMSVRVHAADALRVGAPTPLFDTLLDPGSNRYAPARDGQRFLLSVGTEESRAAPLVVLLNWAEHLAIARGAS